MDIESLEDLVAQQFEQMSCLMEDAEKKDIKTEKIADFVPPIDSDS